MKILLTNLLLCFALFATAQTTDPNAKARTLSGSFSKVSISTGIQLYLTEGNTEAVSVSVSDSKFEENFITEVENGTLKIYFKIKNGKFNLKNINLKAYVTYKKLDGITCAAGSNTVLTNTLNAGSLNLSFSSGSQFKGTVKAESITADASSGAEATVSGTADKLTVTASSGSSFKGANLVTNYCTATAHSGAAVKIEVQKELTASAHSGGEVKYTGSAVITKTDVHSGGSVKKS
ncbi:MAG: head GIN domain-containing protein [Ferruginibacter sp.]